MQPLIILVVIGVGIGAILGTGALENVIDLTNMVQQFGVGEATIDTPITSAYIDFKIEALRGLAVGNVANFKNVITECTVQGNETIFSGSTVICKLTDRMSNVVIEGSKLVTPNDIPPLGLITVQIDDPTLTLNRVENIHDVILVVRGPSALVGN